MVARLFVADNGYRLRFDPVDVIRAVEAVAAGTTQEDSLAAWFRDQLSASP